jgi:hypothetical protein
MKLQGAVIKEQGITFAIVVVKKHVVDIRHKAQEAALGFSRFFPGMPIILMAQDGRGTPTYYGRKDIVKFLSNIYLEMIPWKKYTFSV